MREYSWRSKAKGRWYFSVRKENNSKRFYNGLCKSLSLWVKARAPFDLVLHYPSILYICFLVSESHSFYNQGWYSKWNKQSLYFLRLILWLGEILKNKNGRWLANKYVTSGKKIYETISLSINLLDIMSENFFLLDTMRVKFDTVAKCSEISSFMYISISIWIQETLNIGCSLNWLSWSNKLGRIFLVVFTYHLKNHFQLYYNCISPFHSLPLVLFQIMVSFFYNCYYNW